MAKDFYATLGIQKNSSEQEIKQAYRKLSRELHPDKHAGDKAKEAKFKEVNEAYEVLSDATKKKNYDQFGSADFSGFGGNRGENKGGGFGGGGFQGFDASGFGGDINDIFSSFFSGGTGGRRRDDGRGRSVEIELTLSFMESVVGMKREITFRSLVTCEDCSGSGSEKGSKTVTCGDCNGMGTVTKATRSIFGTIQQSVVCESCRGSGKKPEKPCKHCNGEGRKSGDKTVHVQIPAGIDHGQSLRVQGEGEAGRSGTPAGDLLVRIRVTPDARFEREGDDIRSILPLSMIDAVLGIDASLETVHGTTKVHVPAGTQPGQVLRIKGKGMPVVNTSRHGDHYLTIDLLVPTKLSREEKKLFEELRGIKK